MGKIVKYKMQLEVLTPVHIAGADYKSTLTKAEYVFIEKDKTLITINSEKFINFLMQSKNNSLFEKYFSYVQKKESNIETFLKENNLMGDLKEFTKKEYKNINLEKAKETKNRTNKNESLNTLKLINRDIYGKPIIQGSSIKGAIVNALLVDYIIRNPEQFLDEQEKIYNLIRENDLKTYKDKIKKIVEKIEDKILYLSIEKIKKFGISVSDSYDYETTRVNFYQDIDENLVKSKNNEGMPIVREYIMKGSKFYFDINLDFEILDKTKLKIKDYEDFERRLVNATNYLLEETLRVEKNLQNLVLGANTGFHQKTIIHALFPNKKERVHVVRKILHRDINNKKLKKMGEHLSDKEFSPRVINRVRVNGEKVLAGLVEIKRIEEKIVGGNTNVGSN